MLSTLVIKDVVLIDNLSLNFSEGLCVLTGETGAGKSILLDSLGLALGGRAESSLIRNGASQLSVTASFSLNPKHQVFNFLKSIDIDASDTELVLRRIVNNDGRSKAYINDQPIGIRALKDIGELLVEVHGQFETYGLLNPSNHMSLLDSFGSHTNKRLDCKKAFDAWQAITLKRKQAENSSQKAKSDEEFLRHALEEIEAIKPTFGEEEILSSRRTMLMNSEKLIESLNFAYNTLTSNCDVAASLRKALATIEKIQITIGSKADAIIETLERASIEAEEAITMIESFSSEIDVDPQSLEDIEERLFSLKAIARKHNVDVDFLPNLIDDFRNKLSLVENQEAIIASLLREENQARNNFITVAKILSQARNETANKLDIAVTKELLPLKLEKATFKTHIEPLDEKEWNENGIEKVAFLVSTNQGSPLAPIAKIASGGELARFMLALKVNLAASGNANSIVFDEVDSGIGGATASAVGERLLNLAKTMQVLVVTHSPQVAAIGHNHLKVDKKLVPEKGIVAEVNILDDNMRIEEVARMLSGSKITDEARAAAKVLLSAKESN